MIESEMVTWPGGASAKNDALAVLSRLLDAARRSRFIDYNPAREVKRPSMRESVSPISRALTRHPARARARERLRALPRHPRLHGDARARRPRRECVTWTSRTTSSEPAGR